MFWAWPNRPRPTPFVDCSCKVDGRKCDGDGDLAIGGLLNTELPVNGEREPDRAMNGIVGGIVEVNTGVLNLKVLEVGS